jgi:hypothetical protein
MVTDSRSPEMRARCALADGDREVLAVRAGDGERVRPVERRRAREHLVEDRADAVQVAARVRDLAARRLGGHVQGRAELRARHRETVVDLAGDLRDAVVADLGELLEVGSQGHEHVLGLEVAVQDAGVVSVLEGHQDLPRDVEGALTHSAPSRARILSSRDELHRQVDDALGCPSQDPDAVGVVSRPAAGASRGTALKAVERDGSGRRTMMATALRSSGAGPGRPAPFRPRR